MKEYMLTVVERTPNPDYEEWVSRRRSGFNMQYAETAPEQYLDQKRLDVVLSEDEFNVCRAAVLAEFGPKRDAKP